MAHRDNSVAARTAGHSKGGFVIAGFHATGALEGRSHWQCVKEAGHQRRANSQLSNHEAGSGRKEDRTRTGVKAIQLLWIAVNVPQTDGIGMDEMWWTVITLTAVAGWFEW